MVSKSRSQQGRVRRGFAAMDPEERREISRRGGAASHESGRGHEFNSQEAREAGRLGGEARWGRLRSRSTPSSRSEPEEERSGRSEFRSSRYGQGEEERGVEYDPEQRRGGRREEEEEERGVRRGRRGKSD
jgi:uncharacterized protein